MFGWLQVIIVAIIVATLSYLETRSLNIPIASLTPFKLLAIPYSLILVFQQMCISIYGFQELSGVYIICLVLHFFCVWIVDALFIKSFSNQTTITQEVVDFYISDRVERVLATVGIIIAVLSMYKFINGVNGLAKIGQIVQSDFQTEYKESIGGLVTRLIAMLSTVYFFSTADKYNKEKYVYGFVCLIPNILTFVKSVIFINVVGSIIGHAIVNRTRLSGKKLLAIGVLGVISLYGVYLIEICIWDFSLFFNLDTYSFIFGKLIKYLDAGVQAFNVEISNGVKLFSSAKNFESFDNIIFAPIANLLSRFGIGERINTVNGIFTPIGSLPNVGIVTSNVYTYIGQMVLYCGIIGSMLVQIIITSILNIYFRSIIIKNSAIAIIMYSILGSFYVLGWFDDYFTQTFWGYLMLISLLVMLISRLKIGLRIPRIKVKLGDKNLGDLTT